MVMSMMTGSAAAQQNSNTDLQLLKYNNPGLVTDLGVGLWGWPLPVDYDGDGDMDLLVSSQGKPYNGIYLFENTSGAAIPVFAPPKWLNKSIKDIQVSYVNGTPRFLIPGAELTGFLNRFERDKKPLFSAKEVLKANTGNNRFNQWKLVDYDNDGDDDILIGVDDWGDYGWDNAFNSKGEWTRGPLHGFVYLIENVNGDYINKGRLQVNGSDLDVYGAPTPNMADFDGDGDLDLICGEFLDKLTYFENTGTRAHPVYAAGRYLKNESGFIAMDLEMIVPVAVDWNKDGFTDLVIGDEDGRVALVEHTGRVKNGMPVFKSPYYFQQEAGDVKFGALVTPFSVDWDGDGDEDLICGNSAGYIGFIENLGRFDGMPRWARPVHLKSEGKTIRIQAGNNGSIQGPAEAKWGYTTLSVADWDGDGLKDIIVNSIWGKVVWYKNVGTATQPRLAKEQPVQVQWPLSSGVPKPSWIWWTPQKEMLVTQWRTTPFVTDWNGDGLADLVMLDTAGYLAYFERFKKGHQLLLKPGRHIFEGTNGAVFNHNHVLDSNAARMGLLQLNKGRFGQSGRRKFTIADWDGDGRPDLLVNSVNVSFLKNEGTRQGMVRFADKGPVAKLVLAGHDTSPTTVDWDKDGVRDLLVGAEDGFLYYLKNDTRTR
ncbi:VCBS repeat-containing protein [Niabella sp. 3A5MI-3]|nr:VCBS repeat-containing protein [Niabella beijingensis]